MMPISVVSLSGLGVNANVGLNYITNLLFAFGAFYLW